MSQTHEQFAWVVDVTHKDNTIGTALVPGMQSFNYAYKWAQDMLASNPNFKKVVLRTIVRPPDA